MAPSGLFCMSGPVAHADDDDDDDDICGHSHMPKAVPFHSSPLWGRPCSAVREEMDLLGSEKKSANTNSDVEFLIQQYSECSVKYHCSEGTGKIYWPSGSFYIGEVMGGNLHGIGTYTGADGTVYLGNWILNKKHGFGRKKYANGDVYEGLWKWDLPEGQGHYFWSNGSEYGGDWRNGMMCGIGVLTWVSGDSYDGQWLNGLADGHGVYTWADGSIYIGTWRKGLKCGAGRLYSPGRKCMEILSLPDACIDSKKHAAAGEDWINDHVSSEPSNMLQGVRSGEGASSDKLTSDTETSTQDNDQLHSLVLERLWRLDSSGNCLSRLPAETYLKERPSSFHSENNMVHETKSDYGLWFMKQLKSPGEMVSKDHRSYDLVLALQLGIRHSVVEATPGQNRKVIPTDFGPKARVRANFPRDSSEVTPCHYSAEFKWTDYCPTVFRHLRELSKVDPENYMLSICGSGGFRELPSSGKSGCVFYLTPDERFMIKTLRKAEVKVFLRMLPRYYNHVRMYKNTLLTKFFGLHSIKLAGGQKVQFVVMGNVVSSDSRIHRVYDLKGSSEGRTTNKAETTERITLKDLDLDVVFHLDPCSRDTILEQIHKDCKFLESEHIMDYSLLLGLHFKDPPQNSCLCQGHGPVVDLPLHEVVISSFIAQNGSVESSISETQDFEQANAVPRRKSFVKSGSEEEAEAEKLSFKNERQHIKIGAKMHAKACQSPWQGNCDSFCSESHDVVLYFGIIDILQEYNLSKKLEHAYKSIQFDPLSVSAVDPTLYSKRFQHFMHQIFLLNT